MAAITPIKSKQDNNLKEQLDLNPTQVKVFQPYYPEMAGAVTVGKNTPDSIKDIVGPEGTVIPFEWDHVTSSYIVLKLWITDLFLMTVQSPKTGKDCSYDGISDQLVPVRIRCSKASLNQVLKYRPSICDLVELDESIPSYNAHAYVDYTYKFIVDMNNQHINS